MSSNVYYSLLYLFFFIILLGFSLSLNQAELFVGFLWTTEFTVVLICLILFFYLNVEGNILKINLKLSKIYFFYYLVGFFSLILFFYSSNFPKNYNLNWLFFDFYFDDWYESLNNKLMNDFLILFLSYYKINSIEFLVLGYLLLLTSIICVILNKNSKDSKIESNSSFLKLFFNINNFLNFSFLRKQNLNDQSNYDPNIRVFKKKKWL